MFSPWHALPHLDVQEPVSLHHLVEGNVLREEPQVNRLAKVDELQRKFLVVEHLLWGEGMLVQSGNVLQEKNVNEDQQNNEFYLQQEIISFNISM